MIAWMRVLYIVLTSKRLKKALTIGKDVSNQNLNIDVVCHKYMSTLKDEAIIKISNLTQSEVVQIMLGEFYDVDIYCGYKNGNVTKIFSGGILHLNNKLNSSRTNTLIILCGSQLVANHAQKKLNFTLNSGINLYSAIEFICRRSGIPNSNVSPQLKKTFLTQVMNVNSTPAIWFDNLTKDNDMLISNADGILNSYYSIFDANKSNARVINLNKSNISLTNGYPRLTSEGLDITLLPTFNFVCGDVIKVDNSILDISKSSRSSLTKNYASQFSDKGEYMIFEMHYSLQNRGSNFSLNLQCKNRDRISAYIGEK